MALANFFDKAALAASHLLQGYNRDAFADKLQSHIIGVAFDNAAANSCEGRQTLSLTISLLARLYPRLAIVPLDAKADSIRDILATEALNINPEIEIETAIEGAAACIVVGDTPITISLPTFHVGSEGWLVRTSPDAPVGSGNTGNPFGAGAAACFGAAMVFRQIFDAQLPCTEHEAAWTLSLLDLTLNPTQFNNPDVEGIDLGESFLVGLGAIGNGTVWALSHLPSLRGVLHLIDPETVEGSNLQRYALTTQAHIGSEKTQVMQEALQGTGLHLHIHTTSWGEYLAARGNCLLQRVAVALDSAEDRCAVQASLPRWIANAWTQPQNLAVSRHNFLGDHACLMCLYLPDKPRPNRSQLVAEAVGLPGEERMVRELLYQNAPIGLELIQRIAEALNIPVDPLMPFASKPLSAFYSEAICGGIVLGLGGGTENTARAEAPMAFQSALAGILLAAELVAEAGSIRPPLPTITRIDLLRPLTSHLSRPERKSASNRCICQDKDYQQQYRKKYGTLIS